MSVLILGERETPGGRPLRELLVAAEDTQSDVRSAESVDEVAAEVHEGRYDAILIDLGSGSSCDLSTLDQVRRLDPGTPVVGLIEEEEQGVAVLSRGAQDTLLRGAVELPMLLRTLRYAIERQRVRGNDEDIASEMLSLEAMSSTPRSVTAGAYGGGSLAETAPEVFEELIDRYGEVIDRAMEHELYRDAPGVTDLLRGLGSYLGLLRAHPRDVIEVHVAAVRRRTEARPGGGTPAYLSASRFALVELMGHLAAYFRNYAWGRFPQRDTSTTGSMTEE